MAGKSRAGENNGRAILTEALVRKLVREVNDQRSTGKAGVVTAAAKRYNVARSTVYALLRGDTWTGRKPR